MQKKPVVIDGRSGKSFPPVGECIYCGSDGGAAGLHKEHIMPFALGGTATLPKASCIDCEGITKKLDQYLAHQVFGEFRVLTNAPTRNPKERPTAFSSTIVRDGKTEERLAPIHEHPMLLCLPAFDRPGIILGRKPQGGFGHFTMHQYPYNFEKLSDVLGLKEKEIAEVKWAKIFHPTTFARAIAKIAYCHAVVELGLKGFRRNGICDLIRGRYAFEPYLVGSAGQIPPPYNDLNSLHWLRIGQVADGNSLPGLWKFLVVVSLRLFARGGSTGSDIGFPIYEVVVGSPL